ncbi:MAG: phage-related tail fiber protein [Novosphingobium sp.]|nr:phage-related tail fiber protein [Novosphingobium sp.]
MKVMNGLDLQAQKITNLADPSSNADAANKQYVDNVARGLAWKAPVRAATTANVAVTAPGATLDGVPLAAGDRVLLKNQTAPAQNGIYIWAATASALVRSVDADTAGELTPGTAVSVTEGTVNADKVFVVISDTAITIGTTAQTWGQLGGAGSYSAGNGVSVAGSVISAVAQAGGGVSVGASGIALDPSIAARKFSASIGNGSATAIAVAHGLGTKDVAVTLRQNADDAGVWTDWVATDVNTVTLAFAAAPASSALRVTVVG